MNERIYSPGDAANFLYDSGLLFTINREILNPLSLALVITEDADNNAVLTVVEAEDFAPGIVYDEETLALGAIKYFRYLNTIGNEKKRLRQQERGFIIQPLQFSFVNLPASSDATPLPNFTTSNVFKPVSTQNATDTATTEKTDSTPLDVPEETAKLSFQSQTEKASGRDAAVRKDLKPQTESILAKTEAAVGFLGEQNVQELPDDENSLPRNFDVSQRKIINATKLTVGCVHPKENIVREILSTGGLIIFCTLCGAQFRDGDLEE